MKIILPAALSLLALAGVLGAESAPRPASPAAQASAAPAVKPGEEDFHAMDERFRASYYYAASQWAILNGAGEEAVLLQKRALEHDPRSRYLHTELAETLLDMGEVKQATGVLKEAAAQDPADADLRVKLGALYVEQDDAESAQRSYQEAVKLDPDNLEAVRSLAALDMLRRRYHEALDLLRGALKRHPRSASCRLEMARCLGSLNRGREAGKEYRAVISQQPDLLNAYFQLGLLQETQGRPLTAVETYCQGLSRDPDNLALSSAAAHAVYRAGDWTWAGQMFSDMLKERPDLQDARLYRGLCRLQLSDWKGAEDDFRSLSDTAKGMQVARLYGLGVALSQQGRFGQAEDAFYQALSRNAGAEPVYAQLASVFEQTSRTARAIQVLKQGLEANPDSDDLRGLLASGLRDEKRFSEAEEVLKQGLKGAKPGTGLRFELAVTYDKAGQFPKAERELEKVIRDNPRQAEALNYLGYSWADRGVKLGRAEGLLKRAVKLQPNNPYFLDSLGWDYFKQGKLRQAARELSKATSLLKGDRDPEDAVIFKHLGEVYSRIGRAGDSRRQFLRAVELDPSDKALRARLGLPPLGEAVSTPGGVSGTSRE